MQTNNKNTAICPWFCHHHKRQETSESSSFQGVVDNNGNKEAARPFFNGHYPHGAHVWYALDQFPVNWPFVFFVSEDYNARRQIPEQALEFHQSFLNEKTDRPWPCIMERAFCSSALLFVFFPSPINAIMMVRFPPAGDKERGRER